MHYHTLSKATNEDWQGGGLIFKLLCARPGNSGEHPCLFLASDYVSMCLAISSRFAVMTEDQA